MNWFCDAHKAIRREEAAFRHGDLNPGGSIGKAHHAADH
jgi:hypothetical protein